MRYINSSRRHHDKYDRLESATILWLTSSTESHYIKMTDSHWRRRLVDDDSGTTCVVPQTYSSYGDRAFAAAGHRLWNSLPVEVNCVIQTSPVSTTADRTLFGNHGHCALWLLIRSDLKKNIYLLTWKHLLTYLLTYLPIFIIWSLFSLLAVFDHRPFSPSPDHALPHLPTLQSVLFDRPTQLPTFEIHFLILFVNIHIF